MRGLKARCELAMERILRPIRPDEADFHGESANFEAQLQGMADFDGDITTPPMQFAGESALLEGWTWGQELAAGL